MGERTTDTVCIAKIKPMVDPGRSEVAASALEIGASVRYFLA